MLLLFISYSKVHKIHLYRDSVLANDYDENLRSTAVITEIDPTHLETIILPMPCRAHTPTLHVHNNSS